jgi:hypothetical protein
LDIRSGEEPSAQTPDTAERYSTFREGEDTDYKKVSISFDEEEDSTLEKESESINDKDQRSLLQEGLTEVEEGCLVRRIQQTIISDIRQN